MSNADKRSPHTDALDTLGSIIDDKQARDAIHLAVEPVVAAEHLMPGQDVGFVEGGVGRSPSPVGIVDPFLKAPVLKGERFWLVVYPRQITSLRHVWTHPAFSEAEVSASALSSEPEAVSRRWIEAFAASIPLDCETLLSGADDYVADQKRGGHGEYLCFGGLLEGESVPDEFWPHYEIVRGVKVEEDHRGSFFSCSC
jgi:hypothetical protein